MEPTGRVGSKRYDSAVPASIENVDSSVMLGNGNRESAARRFLINENRVPGKKMEARNGAASRIDGEQETAVLAECQRPL